MGALSIITGGAKQAPKVIKAKPLVSKFDEALANLQRPKGTGNEFLAEVMKQPGVKKAEIEDRKLKQAFEKAGKITKEQAQELAQKRAPAKLEEKILREPSLKEIESHANEAAYQDAVDQARDQGYRGGELDDVAEEIHDDIMSNPDLIGEYMDRAAEDLMEAGHAPSHGEYTLPGGENYREILLKMPAFAGDKKIMELEAMRRRVDPQFHSHRYNELTQQIDELKAQKAQHPQGFEGVRAHYGGEPNILASMRVKDRIMPTYTTEQAKEIGQRIADAMGVADQKNLGNGSIAPAIKNGWVTPKEAAQYADYRGFQGVDTTGAKQKVLHIEEIQSDWHQKARDVRNKEIKRIMKEEGIPKKDAAAKVPEDYGYRSEDTAARREELQKLAWPYMERNEPVPADIAAQIEELRKADQKVADAPFKKNWQELAIKKAINYAVENGYDKIALTPGAEHVERYNLSKFLKDVHFDPATGHLAGRDHQGKLIVAEQGVTPDNLSEYIGKEGAQKILDATPDSNGIMSLSGADLKVGGEGMLGFYDKILPDYLNTLGKKHGIKVGEMDIETKPAKRIPVIGEHDIDYVGRETEPAQFSKVHSFDITPELREEVTTKGLPLYQQIGLPLGTGVGSYEFNAPEPEYAAGGAVNYNTDPDMSDGGEIIQGAPYKKGGKVRITDNLDEMFMEVNNKKFQRK